MGATAIFTFNLDTLDVEDASVISRGKTTEVHTRTDDGWQLVHAHWSYREPPPA